MERDIHIFDNPEALARAATEDFIELACRVIASEGSFHVALSGGRTPKRLFEQLAQADYQSRIDWPHIHVYFGDERCVPPDHPDSNYRLARESLLDKVACPEENIHRIEAENDPEKAALDYRQLLRDYLPRNELGQTYFDLIFLGIGTDGHTASLFPGTSALHDTEHDCLAVYVDKLHSWRITLGYPVINRSRQVWLLAEGESKAEILRAVSRAAPGPEPYPINGIQPAGEFRWYLDAAAGRLLLR